jgi:hypothetical protein
MTERSKALFKSFLVGMALPFGMIVIAAMLGALISYGNGYASIPEMSKAAAAGALVGGFLALFGGLEMIFGFVTSGVFDRRLHWSDHMAMAAGYAAIWVPVMYFMTSRI